jgi:hypothetical protein
MKSKLIFFFFIFILLTISSKEENILKRKRKDVELKHQNTQTFVFPFTEDMKIHELQFIFPSNTIRPSDLLLNKILKNSKNTFAYIFPYLTFFELEFEVQFVCKAMHELYEKFKQEEKNILKSALNLNISGNYFDFFEKRKWRLPSREDFVNANKFSENLFIFPKSIRQILCFISFRNIQYKYVLFKTGKLIILKKIDNKFKLISPEHDFQKVWENENFDMKLFCENVGFVTMLQGIRPRIMVYKKETNIIQIVEHYETFKKIGIRSPKYCDVRQVLFLKNLSGILTLHLDNIVDLWKFEQQEADPGFYLLQVFENFKQNVKNFQSEEYQHFSDEVQFQFLE